MKFSTIFTFEATLAQEIGITELKVYHKKLALFYIDMFTSLENQNSSSQSITILVFVTPNRASIRILSVK